MKFVALDVNAPGTVRLPIFAVIILEVVKLELMRLARVLTRRLVMFAPLETFRVTILAVVRLPVAMFAVVKLELMRFARVLTRRLVMVVALETFRVTMLAVTTLSVAMFAVVRLASALTWRLVKLAEPDTLSVLEIERDDVLMASMLAVPRT